MKNIRTLVLVQMISLLTLQSCINEIDIEIHSDLEVPVLSCVLRPYQPVKVYLGTTVPVGTRSNKDLSAAVVLLYEEHQLIDTLKYTSDDFFESKLSAIPGYSYEIVAWINGRSVRGADQLPLQNNVHIVTEDLVESHNGSGDQYYNYKITFTQNDLLEEYFELSRIGINCQNDTCGAGYLFPGPNQDPVIIAEGILDFNPLFFVFSDVLFKGDEQVVFLQFMNTTANGAQELVGQELPTGRFIRFSSISKEAYLFKKSLLRYHANINTDDRLHDLKALFFGAEPSNLYSNIEGGKGMVMGVNEQYFPVKY